MSPTATPVAHMKLTTTVAAPEKSHQQTLPGTDCRHGFVSLPVHGVATSHTSILFVGCPVNISYVMIADKDPALFGATGCTLALLQPTLDQQGRHGSTSPNIGAGVEGIA